MGNNFHYEIASFQELKAITEEMMPGKIQSLIELLPTIIFCKGESVGNFKKSFRGLFSQQRMSGDRTFLF